MRDDDAILILRRAQYNALDEIVRRGICAGQAIQRGDYGALRTVDSIFDAVNAYYVSRRATEVAENEGS